MPHSPEEKKRALTRLKRIRGQAEALERAIEKGTDCGELLQQIAALRGAANGLMVDVLDGHLRETFIPLQGKLKNVDITDEVNLIAKILKTYLR
jgi:FrmR/RcnR family transcriptional regulator, repressor of frmRAB operon